MATGCAAEVSSEQPGQGDVKRTELDLKAEAALREYVASLVKREEASLKAVVSSEILDRAAGYRGLPAFLEKQRRSLVKQYGDDPNLALRVSVGRAVLDGNVVTADIGVDGLAVQKPWHFIVADDGSLKVNSERFAGDAGRVGVAGESLRVNNSLSLSPVRATRIRPTSSARMRPFA